MSRDSTGNYSSPSGDFVTATVIDSNVMNGKLQDFGTEMTDSLSRSGKGGMLARLRGVDGTINLPAYSFTDETTLGFWRAGAGDLRATKDGTNLQKWSTAEVRVYQAFKVSAGGATIDAGGLTVTAGGLTVAAGGADVTGALPAQGGVAPASRFATTGAISTTSGHTHAILGLTDFQAGATNNPVRLNVRSENSTTVDEWQDVRVGLSYDEANSSPGVGGKVMLSPREGVIVTSGTNAAADEPANALTLTNGNLKLSGTAPNKDEALANTLTPANIPKAWAKITTNATTTPTVNAGFNVGAAAAAAQTLTLDIASDVSADSTVLVTCGNNNAYYIYNATCSGSQVTIKALDGGGPSVPFSAVDFEITNALVIHVVVFGTQS